MSILCASVQLKDKSAVSMKVIEGKCKITFHALDKTIYLPVGTELNTKLVERLYQAYRQLASN